MGSRSNMIVLTVLYLTMIATFGKYYFGLSGLYVRRSRPVAIQHAGGGETASKGAARRKPIASSQVPSDCLYCICEVESNCRMPSPLCHEDGGSFSCGPYQIKLSYWQDALLRGGDLDGTVDDKWVIDAAGGYFLYTIYIPTLKPPVKELKRTWSQSPHLARTPLEKTKLSRIDRKELKEDIVMRWRNTDDYSSIPHKIRDGSVSELMNYVNGHYFASHEDWKTCSESFECSERAVQGYMARYATYSRIGHEPTCEDFARIHNGGPNGYKNQATVGYWNRVNACL